MAKSKKINILLTGAHGYIGTRLAQLLHKKYKIIGTDIGFFKNCILGNYKDPIKIFKSDLRNFNEKLLKNIDTVIHMGALSNDPSSELNHQITKNINYESTIKFAKLCKKNGVKRFIFSSSCIMYGSQTSKQVNEQSTPSPKTIYAKSKVWAEKNLKKLADKNFSPVYLRNGTIYGYSPRMRFDTVLNDFCLQAFSNKKIFILSKGEQYRPVIYLDDVVKCIEIIINAPSDKIHNQAFNIGSDKNNIKILNLAKMVKKISPNIELEVLNEENHDNRSYIASFKKIKKVFPKLKFSHDYKLNLKFLIRIMEQNKKKIGIENYSKFIRLKWLKHLKEKKIINKNLELK